MKIPKSKRTSTTTSVGDAINDLLDNYNLKERFDEKRLVDSWGELMGKTIANRTNRIFIKNKVLFIELSSAPLKKELTMSKDKLISIFEKEYGKGIVAEIIFM
jgi:predicted nucleic acid-binding Zn ribbon protein